MVKLIEPNYGRLVTIQVLEEHHFLRDMIIGILTAPADGKNLKANVSGNIITLTFSNTATADAYRAGFKLDQYESLKRGK